MTGLSGWGEALAPAGRRRRGAHSTIAPLRLRPPCRSARQLRIRPAQHVVTCPGIVMLTLRHVSFLPALVVVAQLAACGGSPSPSASTPAVVADLLMTNGLGSACAAHGDCAGGVCDRTVPGGYCTAGCETDADCPDEGICGEGYCLQRCVSQRECRSEEFQCYASDIPDVGVCGFDLSAVTPAAPNTGAACRATVECMATSPLQAACMPSTNQEGGFTGWQDGMCVAMGCGGDVVCDAGFACVEGPVSICLPACTADSDCRTGYACAPDFGACMPVAN